MVEFLGTVSGIKIEAPTGEFATSLTISGIPVATGTGVTDHGDLTGLVDDDHLQYLLEDGTRPISADWDNTGQRIRNTGTAEVIPTAPAVPITGLFWFDTAASGITGSGVVLPLVTITTDTALTPSNVVVLCNAVSAPILVTLPTTSGDSGRKFYVKKVDASANKVTISGNSIAQLIDGGITAVITTQYESIPVVGDGINWNIL